MLGVRGNARAWTSLRTRASLLPIACQSRCLATKKASKLAPYFKAETPLAERLAKTGIWVPGPRSKQKVKTSFDRTRVNIVSEKLCDDVLSYIRPSLERHVGCDLIDLYPGAGLWSSKLHEALQPRSHIMLEPDAELYKPYLEPLLAKPGTHLLPKMGVVFDELDEAMQQYLPHQKVHTDWETTAPQRNDTLLVTANLSWFPKKKFKNFESLAQLVLHQFLSWVRSASMFQRYGLVRMLIWCDNDSKRSLIPRSIQRRRRTAITAEMATEWVVEVAGSDDVASDDTTVSRYQRDSTIDLESCRRAMKRMEEMNITTPPGRESSLMKTVRELGQDHATEAGSAAPKISRGFEQQLAVLEAAFANGEFGKGSPQWDKLQYYRFRQNWMSKRQSGISELLQKRDALVKLHESGTADPTELANMEAEWNKEVGQLNRLLRLEFMLHRDNLHIFRQDPPVMLWDRRYLEPLVVQPAEFFPNAPCALLDIQPKAMHPLLHMKNPKLDPTWKKKLAEKGGFELIERVQGQLLSQNVIETPRFLLNEVAPGLGSLLVPQCESLRDRARGGMPLGGWAEIGSRSLNEGQFIEILERYLESPHTPCLGELVHGEPIIMESDEDLDDFPQGGSLNPSDSEE